MLRPLLRSVRPHQWPKNIFVLGPLAFSENLTNAESLRRAGLATVAFIAVSSAVYLINDILDRPRDRRHPIKRLRPLASGALSVSTAVVAALALVLAGAVGAAALGAPVAVVLATYLALNLLYSPVLKRIVILDVMIVASGFVLRVVAGAEAIRVETSHWLLICTTFLALLMALSKRRHELVMLEETAGEQREVLRRYSTAFLDPAINAMAASTLLAYALYAVAPETVEKFETSALIYTLPFVLFGVFRYLYLVYHLQDQRNPTEAILRDLPFAANVVLWMGAVTAIIYLR